MNGTKAVLVGLALVRIRLRCLDELAPVPAPIHLPCPGELVRVLALIRIRPPCLEGPALILLVDQFQARGTARNNRCRLVKAYSV